MSVTSMVPAMGAGNQVGIGLSYRPASLCSLATQFQIRFLESIPRPIAGLKFSALLVGEVPFAGLNGQYHERSTNYFQRLQNI